VKKTTITYEISDLVSVDVTWYQKSKIKNIEIIVGGEGKNVSAAHIVNMFRSMAELMKDLKLKP